MNNVKITGRGKLGIESIWRLLLTMRLARQKSKLVKNRQGIRQGIRQIIKRGVKQTQTPAFGQGGWRAVILGLISALVFLWLISRHVHWSDVFSALQQITMGSLLLALMVLALDYWLRIQRWYRMLLAMPRAYGSTAIGKSKGKKSTSLKQPPAIKKVSAIFLASYAGNNLLPLRMGDFLRVFWFNRMLGISSLHAVATLLVERLLDLLAVLAIFAMALMLLPNNFVTNESLNQLIASSAVAVLFGVLLAVMLLLQPHWFAWCMQVGFQLLHWLARGLSRFNIKKLVQALEQQMAYFFDGIKKLRPILFGLFISSLVIWLLEGVVYLLVIRGMNFLTPPAVLAGVWLLPKLWHWFSHSISAWVLMAVGTLATLLPSTPGALGTYDFFVASMGGWLSGDLTLAVAFAFFIHIVLWLPLTLIGFGSGYWLLRQSKRRPA